MRRDSRVNDIRLAAARLGLCGAITTARVGRCRKPSLGLGLRRDQMTLVSGLQVDHELDLQTGSGEEKPQ